jgi:uncharacterized protein (TIGR03437 family)
MTIRVALLCLASSAAWSQVAVAQAPATTSAPVITAVMNNSSTIPAGFPNSGVAPSSLFVIQGSGMATPGSTAVLQDSTKGLPTMLNGASLSVTVGGTTVTPAIYYSSPTQIAAVLPAATPPGNGTITVSYGGTPSTAAPIQVVPSAFGFDLYHGWAVATDATSGALITDTNSAQPGEVLIFWGTGLGSDPADSDNTYTASPHAIGTPVQMYIGNALVPAAAIAYSGASVYPGVDVIGVTIPAGVLNGCFVPVALVTGSGASAPVSNIATLPIMNGGGSCSDPMTGMNGTLWSSLGSQSLVRTGEVEIGQSVADGALFTTAVMAFVNVGGPFFPDSGVTGAVSVGGCSTLQILQTANYTNPVVASETSLAIGTLTIQAPGGSFSSPPVSGVYETTLPASTTPTEGGTFVITSSGGANVGPFTATVTVPTPVLNWTNQSAAATITRTQGLPVTWSGGAPGSYVHINGSSSNGSAVGSFDCYAPQSALQFTVPPFVLSALPVGKGSAVAAVQNLAPYAPFSAQGLDTGDGLGFTTISITSKIQ